MSNKVKNLSSYLYDLGLVKESNLVEKLIKESGKKERGMIFGAAKNNKFLGYTTEYEGPEFYKEEGYTEKEFKLVKDYELSNDIKTSFDAQGRSLILMGCLLAFGEAEFSSRANTISEYILSKKQSKKVFEYLGLNKAEFNKIIIDRDLIKGKMSALYEEYKKKRDEDLRIANDVFVTNDIVYSFKNGWNLVYVPSANSILSDSITVSEENKKEGGFSKDREREGNLMGMCLGSGSKLYHEDIHKIYSIRDPKNKPKVTIRIKDNELQESKSRSNNVPSVELTMMIKEAFLHYLTDVSTESCSDFTRLPPTELSDVQSSFSKDRDNSITKGYGKFWYKDDRTPEIKNHIDKSVQEDDFRLISASFPSEGPEYFEGLAERCAKNVPEKLDFFMPLNSTSEVNTSWKYYKKKPWCIDAVKRLVASDKHRSLFFSLALFENYPYKDFVSDEDIRSFMLTIEPSSDGNFANDMTGLIISLQKVYGSHVVGYLKPHIFFISKLNEVEGLEDIVLEKAKGLGPSFFFEYKLHEDPLLESVALEQVKDLNSDRFFMYKLHNDPRFETQAIERVRGLDSSDFFEYRLHEDDRFKSAALEKAKGLDSSDFFMYKLHNDPRFETQAIEKSQELDSLFLIEHKLHDDSRFRNLSEKYVRSLNSHHFFQFGLHKDPRFIELSLKNSKNYTGADHKHFFHFGLHKEPQFAKDLPRRISDLFEYGETSKKVLHASELIEHFGIEKLKKILSDDVFRSLIGWNNESTPDDVELSSDDFKIMIDSFDDLNHDERVKFLNLVVDSGSLSVPENKIHIRELMIKVDLESLKDSKLYNIKKVSHFLGKFSRRMMIRDILLKTS
jgi:hypothetical protein